MIFLKGFITEAQLSRTKKGKGEIAWVISPLNKKIKGC
jgi:hypothetical protein